MKYCKDCVHYKLIPGCYLQPVRHLCANPRLGNDLITGEPITIMAEYCRKYLCGISADWFEEDKNEIL